MRRHLRLISLLAVAALAVGALAVARPSLAGGQQDVTVKPTKLNLGRVTVGQTASKYVTVTNNSTGTVWCNEADMSGPFSTGDGWYDCYYSGIPAGSSTRIAITFTPGSAGRFTSDNAHMVVGGFTFTFKLSGTGLPAGA